MRQPARTAALTVTAALASLALLIAASAQPDDPAKGIRILYPADRSIHVGSVRVIVAVEKDKPAPLARMDGKPFPLSRMGFAGAWAIPGRLKATAARVGDRAACVLFAADVPLSPGPHRISIGGQQIELRGAKDLKPAALAGWSAAFAHRMLPTTGAKLDCGSCHDSTGGEIGAVDTPKVCAPCHNETNVQLIHGHVPQPLNKCGMCHDPHGASRRKLLVDSKEKLCAKCHGSGHFRG